MGVTTADYQINFNGLTMGTDTAYDILAVVGAGMPSIRSVDVNKQDDHGTYPSRRELMQARTINLEVDALAIDTSDLHTKMKALRRAFAYSEEIRPLYLRFGALGWGESAGTEVVMYGYVRQFTTTIGESSNFNVNKVFVQFECPDPRIYSEQLHTVTVSPQAAPSGGWTFPWTFPWTFGVVASESSFTITNNGITDTGMFVRIFGPSTNPRIANLVTGEFMEIDIAIALDHFLDLDFRAQTALLDGTASRFSFRQFGSTWFPTRPGTNVLQYTCIAGTGTAQVSWRDAYI